VTVLGWSFYKANWATIKDDIGALMNQMFMERNVSTQHKHGVIVCLPKSRGPTTPADFRPIALLNTDYKILARIIAYRLRPMRQSCYNRANGYRVFPGGKAAGACR
jgi:hypothetical protein